VQIQPASSTADLTVVTGAGDHLAPGSLATQIGQVVGGERFVHPGIHRGPPSSFA
jgi:hypothetical protein